MRRQWIPGLFLRCFEWTKAKTEHAPFANAYSQKERRKESDLVCSVCACVKFSWQLAQYSPALKSYWKVTASGYSYCEPHLGSHK